VRRGVGAERTAGRSRVPNPIRKLAGNGV